MRYAVIEACADPSDMPFATFTLAIGLAKGDDAEEPRLIVTLRGAGYRLDRDA